MTKVVHQQSGFERRTIHPNEIVHQWAPERGFVSRVLPATSDSWSPTSSVVARYLLFLSALGIEDPTRYRKSRATDFFAQALSLREHTTTIAAKNDGEADIANRLAQGELNPSEAAKALAKLPTAREEQEKEERGRRMLADAVRAAYSAAVLAVHTFGEERWLQVLRPLVAEAVAAQDQGRWDALHSFASLLRHSDLAAMAIVGDTSGMREFTETWRYRTARPDLVHEWRAQRAVRTHAAAHVNVGSNVFVGIAVTEGPHPTLQDMVEGQMLPGLFSASEVLSITEDVLAEQEAAQMSAEPAPRSRRIRVEVS